jgi:hypothetical protein
MYAGTGSIRVVSFRENNFRFRLRQDELLSFEYDVGPFDLNGDSNLEFVQDERFPSDLDTKGIRIPRIKQWSFENGFIDKSSEYPAYYKQRIIPELRQLLMEEQDPELRDSISQAIDFLTNQVLVNQKTSAP